MSLSEITRTDVIENGIAHGYYKKFEVSVSQVGREQFKFNIGIALDDDSDSTHWLATDERVGSITQAKIEVKGIVNSYGYSATDILKLQKSVDLCNHGKSDIPLLSIDEILKEHNKVNRGFRF